MAATRRLAAILAADVAGYSRLMGQDEAGTAQALREHRTAADPLVAEHGGRIVKTTGDGALIEFASVVGAVECALALQQLTAGRNAGIAGERRMEWRIGIHLGDILGDGVVGCPSSPATQTVKSFNAYGSRRPLRAIAWIPWRSDHG